MCSSDLDLLAIHTVGDARHLTPFARAAGRRLLVVEASDEEVNEALENLAKNAQSFEDRKKGTKSKSGDQVVIDFKGMVDGEAFDGGSAEDYPLVLGSGSFIPGFEEQMVGMNIGEEKDLNVTFPTEYHAPDLAGKEAVFHVKVNSTTETQLPGSE